MRPARTRSRYAASDSPRHAARSPRRRASSPRSRGSRRRRRRPRCGRGPQPGRGAPSTRRAMQARPSPPEPRPPRRRGTTLERTAEHAPDASRAPGTRPHRGAERMDAWAGSRRRDADRNLDDLSPPRGRAEGGVGRLLRDTRRTGNLFARHGLTTPRCLPRPQRARARRRALLRLEAGETLALVSTRERRSFRIPASGSSRPRRGRAPRRGDPGPLRRARDPVRLGLPRGPVHVPRLPALAPRRRDRWYAAHAARAGTVVLFESPFRVVESLEALAAAWGDPPSLSAASSRRSTRRSCAAARPRSRARSGAGRRQGRDRRRGRAAARVTDAVPARRDRLALAAASAGYARSSSTGSARCPAASSTTRPRAPARPDPRRRAPPRGVDVRGR